MVIPEQYPSDLWLLTVEEGSLNSNGDIVGDEPSWINISKCREEKKAGKKVLGNDGNYHDFSSMVYTPAGCPQVQKGASIEVRDGANVRMAGTCVLFEATVNHCRLWV